MNNTIPLATLQNTDLVFARGNEEQFVKMGKRLGTKHLIFCYTLNDPLIKSRKKEVAMLADSDITTEFAVLIDNQNDINKAKTLAASIVAVGKPEIFEDKRVDYVMDFEIGRRGDFIHHRNSGLNQVFISAAKKTGKTFFVNANNLLYGNPPHVILGRMMQNNEFFRKYSPDVMVISGAREPMEMRATRDLRVLLSL